MPCDPATPLLGTAERLKHPGCPSADEWAEKMRCVHTVEYYAATNRKETLPLVTTQMDLEGVVLHGVSQTEKGTECMMSLACGI